MKDTCGNKHLADAGLIKVFMKENFVQYFVDCIENFCNSSYNLIITKILPKKLYWRDFKLILTDL